MKTLSLTAVLLASCAGSAMAGSYTAPVIIAAPIIAPPATITDWRGPYVGALVSFNSAGEYTVSDAGLPVDTNRLDSNTSFGGFAGYNFQNRAFVYGGEVAVHSGGMSVFGTDISFGPVIDLKARAGFTLGSALAYGVVGGSFATLHDTTVPQDFASSGFAYGAGVDLQLNEHWFVGAEYLVRDLSGTSNDSPTETITSSLQSVQLRVGWKF